MDVGAVKAPTIRRSYPCKRSRQLVPQDDLVRDRGDLPIGVYAADELRRRWRKVLVQKRPEEKKNAGHALDLGAIPDRNYRGSLIKGQDRGFDANDVLLRPCFACARLCPWDVTIGEGPRAGPHGRHCRRGGPRRRFGARLPGGRRGPC